MRRELLERVLEIWRPFCDCGCHFGAFGPLRRFFGFEDLRGFWAWLGRLKGLNGSFLRLILNVLF